VEGFLERGRPWSEVANESIIEAVDSLLPYMHARDVAYMVDNCSRTARLGTRRWGPRFQAAYEQIAFPATEKDTGSVEPAPVDEFADHLVHDALAAAAALRPPVAISVA
jgi:ketol-acid reductoisomerase